MHAHDDPERIAAAPRRPTTVAADARAVDVRRAAEDAGSVSPASLVELQRLAGNTTVSRMVAPPEDEVGIDGPSPIFDATDGQGEALDPALRADMEARLGAAFGDVRIHRDEQASESARSVNANAYTVGSDIVFRSDRWAPGTSEGKRTLAHELTHVVQQASGPVAGSPAPGGIRLSDPDDEFERAADRTADAAMAGVSPASVASGPTATAQLQAAGDELDEEEEEAREGQFAQRETALDEEEELDEEELGRR